MFLLLYIHYIILLNCVMSVSIIKLLLHCILKTECLLLQMAVILRESSTLLDEYLTSHVLQLDDAMPGLQVTFAVYLDTNSNTESHEIETVVRDFLNRYT